MCHVSARTETELGTQQCVNKEGREGVQTERDRDRDRQKERTRGDGNKHPVKFLVYFFGFGKKRYRVLVGLQHTEVSN